MKRLKVCSLVLSTCLTIGVVAGCFNGGTTPTTAASASAESETSTEAAASETDPTEAPETYDSSGIQNTSDIDDEIIELTAERQEYANIIVSNFAEQFITDFDWKDASTEELMDFAHMFLKINNQDAITYEKKGDVTYETFTFSDAHDVIVKHIGVFISDVALEGMQAPSGAYGDQPAGPYYEDSKIWYEAADGESHNLVAIVDTIMNNYDGTYTLTFTIYAIDMDTYSRINSDELKAYYKLNREQAASDSTLGEVVTGKAVVSVGQSGEYYMLTYHTNKG